MGLGKVHDEIRKPLPAKLERAREVIRRHLVEFPPERVYVSWSGGKDSTLVLWLVMEQHPKVKAVFVNTGVEFPETVRFVRDFASRFGVNLVELRPKATFWEVVERYGFPRFRWRKADGRSKNPACCRYLKERPVKEWIRKEGILAEFSGVTAVESKNRMITAMKYGFCHHVKDWGICKIKPILFFTEEDVWELHDKFGIPRNPAYEFTDRLGCVTCTGFQGWERRMMTRYPKLYNLVVSRMGKGQLCLPLGR